MKGRWSFWLALVVSLFVNGFLLSLLFVSFNTPKLLFSQSAGSNVDHHYVHIQLISAEHSSVKTEEEQAQVKEIPDKSVPFSHQISAGRQSSALDSSLDVVKTIQSDQKIEIAEAFNKLSEGDFLGDVRTAEKNRSVAAKDQKQELVTPKRSQPYQEKKPPKVNAGVKNSDASISAQARLGDQFATELSVKVMQQIEGCYPEASKRRGEEGVVLLRLFSNAGGLDVRVIESSGFTRLDRCAVTAVQKAFMKSDITQLPSSGLPLKPIRFKLR